METLPIFSAISNLSGILLEFGEMSDIFPLVFCGNQRVLGQLAAAKR
jgi:hypothetical protein